MATQTLGPLYVSRPDLIEVIGTRWPDIAEAFVRERARVINGFFLELAPKVPLPEVKKYDVSDSDVMTEEEYQAWLNDPARCFRS